MRVPGLPEPEEVHATMAENVREAIQRAGLSQNQVADLCGIGRASLSRVLSGDENITVVRLARLAAVLDVPAWQLLKP